MSVTQPFSYLYGRWGLKEVKERRVKLCIGIPFLENRKQDAEYLLQACELTQ